MLTGCRVVQLVLIQDEFVSTTKREEEGPAEDVLLLKSVSQSLRSDKLLNKILKEVCEVWALVFLCQTMWQEWFNLDSKGRGRGSGVGGFIWGHFCCRRRGREWRLLLSTLHTLFNGPFLRQTNWTKKTTDKDKTWKIKRKIIIQYTQNMVLKTGGVHAVFLMCSVPVMGKDKGFKGRSGETTG